MLTLDLKSLQFISVLGHFSSVLTTQAPTTNGAFENRKQKTKKQVKPQMHHVISTC